MKHIQGITQLPPYSYWSLVSLIVIVIGYFSLTPVPLSEFTGGEGLKLNFNYMHILAYFGLSFALGLALRNTKLRKESYFYAIEFSFVFSILIELMQNFIPGRYFGLDDILFNLIGILLAQGLRKYLDT